MKRSIDIKKLVSINGIDQKIHIVSTDMNNPVVLCIHGGPGVVNRHNVVKCLSGVLEKLTIVGWDQRGTGGSYKGVTEKDMTVQAIVDDAKKMVEYICEKFNKEKIYIYGHSWGSCVGTLLAYKHPEKIEAYFGVGQLVNGMKNEELSYDYTLKKAKEEGDVKSLAILEEIGKPIKGLYKNNFLKSLVAQRRILAKYGTPNMEGSSMWKSTIKPILFSGEYTLMDIYGVIRGYEFTLKSMWPQVVKLDFAKNCKKFSIPMFYFIGVHDNTTPKILTKKYYNIVEAPIKDLVWFEHSAHNPLTEETEKFVRVLVEKIYQIEGM